jgi:uncharacterized protein YggE
VSPKAGVALLVVMVAIWLGPVRAAMGQPQGAPPGPPMMRPPSPSIAVEGSGSAAAPPDVAQISAGVVTQSATAAQALAANNASMDKVLKAVSALGIASKDVQTTSVSVVPQRRQQGRPDGSPPEIVGYEVSNQVRVTVRDLGALGRLLDELVGQGANVLGGVSFSVADPAPLLDQARVKAMADARHRAEVYATAAGVKVGRLLAVREGTAAIPRLERPFLRAAGPVPIAPGEQEVQVSVSVTYGIE